MSEDDDLGNEGGEGIKSLRKQYDTIKAQNEELAKQLREFQAKERTSTVANVLKARGLPETAAKLYTGDDTSEDAVGKWLDEFADVFGTQAAPQQQGAVDAGTAQAVTRIANAAQGSNGPVIGSNTAGQPVVGDPRELTHLIRTLPYEELQKRGLMPQSGTLFSR